MNFVLEFVKKYVVNSCVNITSLKKGYGESISIINIIDLPV